MKNDAQREAEANRVHGEIQLSMTRDPARFTAAAVRRIRQIECDAVLDFIDDLLVSLDQMTKDGKTPVQTGACVAMAFLCEEQRITRAPSSGCKDGKCRL